MIMDASATLPNELWLQAFGYLSKADLKALRLTAEPHISTIASSLLFTTAYIAARGGVLDTFTSLTTHPVFRHHVKEVVFDSSYIDPAKLTEHADDKTEATLASFFQEQERIQANELQIRLENAFKCLSNVKKVYCCIMQTCPGSRTFLVTAVILNRGATTLMDLSSDDSSLAMVLARLIVAV